MVDQQQARDWAGRTLAVHQQVILRDCRVSRGWPSQGTPLIGHKLWVVEIEDSYSPHWDDWIVTVAVLPGQGSVGVLASWLQASDVGLRGLVKRYRQEVAHG